MSAIQDLARELRDRVLAKTDTDYRQEIAELCELICLVMNVCDHLGDEAARASGAPRKPSA